MSGSTSVQFARKSDQTADNSATVQFIEKSSDGDDSVDGEEQCDGIGAFDGSTEKEMMAGGNQLENRKKAITSFMEVSLMMANISQLRTLYVIGPDGMESYYFLFVLVVLSLVSQISFVILLLVVFKRERHSGKMEDEKKHLEEHLANMENNNHMKKQMEEMKTRMKQMEAEMKQVDEQSGIRNRFTSLKQVVSAIMHEEPEKEKVRQQVETKREEIKEYDRPTKRVDTTTMVLVFLITVINMFITGFGIQLTNKM